MDKSNITDIFFAKNAARTCLVILILTIFITYSPLLNDSFWADDYLHIDRISSLQSGDFFEKFFSAWILNAGDTSSWWTSAEGKLQYFRPLISFSFLCDHLIWQDNPFGFHLTNIIFHILTSILVFLLAKIIFKKETTALLVALIFGIHPCHMEAVSWICCRTDVIAGFFYFFSIVTFLIFKNKDGKRRFFIFAFSLLLYACALLSKEMAITLPVILVLLDLFSSSSQKKPFSLYADIKSSFFLYLPFFLITMFYLGIRFKIFGGLGSVPFPFFHSPFKPGFFLFVLRNMILYFANILYFVPIDLLAAYPFFLKHPILLILLAILVLGGILFLAKNTLQRKKALFLFFLGIFSMLPVFSLSLGQRFLYIPSVFFFLCLGYTGWENRRSRKVIIVSYLTLIFFVSQIGNMVSDGISCRMDKIIDEIKPHLKESSVPKQLYFIDLPILALIGLPHALRLECPDARFSVDILSVSPDIVPTQNPFRSYLKISGPNTLIVGQKDATYFQTYIEQVFFGGDPDIIPGKVYTGKTFTVKISRLKKNLPQEMIFCFDSPLTDQNKIFFRGENMQVFPIKILEK